MINLTMGKSHDGFGSLLLSSISGMAFAKIKGYNYIHTEFSGIKLLDKPDVQNTDLERANLLIRDIIKNLGYRMRVADDEGVVQASYYVPIIEQGVDLYYTDEFLKKLQDSYSMKKPSYYKNDTFNIAIHIRRGHDIFKNEDIQARIIPNEVYENIIKIFQQFYSEATIHIFSWTNPNLNIDNKNVVYHITESGDKFLDDFNGLVHSDILVAGSSTFSLSAGMFNKGLVLCGEEVFKLHETPFPTKWKNNYNNIIKNEKSNV